MKRLIAVALALLLLAGCKKAPLPTTAPITTNGATEPTVTLYDPNSYIEEVSEGAVRGYPVADHTVTGFRVMGDKLLLFTMDDHVEYTTLMLLEGEKLSVTKRVMLDCALYPSDAHLQIGEDALGYYNQEENCIVFLDGKLNETKRVTMPDDVTDLPVLSRDLKQAYFCAGEEIRVMDTETGIVRLLKQHACRQQSLVGLHLNDRVLEAFVTQEDDRAMSVFISAESGETLDTDNSLLSMQTQGDFYLISRMDGTVRETLVGRADGSPEVLRPNYDGFLRQVFSVGGVLAGQEDLLELYDLGSGEITARISLGDGVMLLDAAADREGTYIWILANDPQLGGQCLYRWLPTASEVVESKLYLSPRYTVSAPDTEGIALCQQEADTVGEKYGVSIIVGSDFPTPKGYEFQYEHQPRAFEYGIARLDSFLSRFPEDFFSKLSAVSKSGSIRIALVRDMKDIAGGQVPDCSGLHFVDGGEHYIVLTIGPDMEQTFYHELCHALDAYVYGGSLIYDDWELLNPKGFQYFGTYQNWQVSEDDPNLNGESRAFVDGYSMTFAREDRAQLFAQAMLDGNSAMFEAPMLQNKLKQMSLAIREAYGWEKLEQTLPWEQYLAGPEAE